MNELTIYDATQWIANVRTVLADALDMPADKVRVIAPFIGGGFGSKGYCWPHEILTAIAARTLRRPLKVVLTRAQMYTSHGYQTGTVQHVTLGAARDGRLLAIRHETVNAATRDEDYVEFVPIGTRSLYASAAIETRARVARLDKVKPTAMRAPHEGPGQVGLEIAMDELAYRLAIDPLQLRLLNYADTDPTTQTRFSSKELRRAYELAAERFGWQNRDHRPRSMRDGRHHLGWGMATAIMSTFRFPSSARITMTPNGFVVEAAFQEIGAGGTTIFPQIAADTLGVPLGCVYFVHGDSKLPTAGPSTGSSATMGLGSAIHDAATKLKAKLTALDGGDPPDRAEACAELLRRHGLHDLGAEGTFGVAGGNALGEVPEWSMATFGAIFAEVRIDPDYLVPRLTRLVGAYSAGRIINPRTARSQITGGMIWGVGQALLEQSLTDPRAGRFLSKNLSGYMVPVQADVPDLDVIFVDEDDRQASPIGARGIGELGAVGVGAAIANAVFHATGTRVCSLPITPEAVLN